MQALLVNKMVCPSSDGYVRLPSGRIVDGWTDDGIDWLIGIGIGGIGTGMN